MQHSGLINNRKEIVQSGEYGMRYIFKLLSVVLLIYVLVPQRLDQSLSVHFADQDFKLRAILGFVLLLIFGFTLIRLHERESSFSSLAMLTIILTVLASWLSTTAWALGKSLNAIMLFLGPMALWPIIASSANTIQRYYFIRKIFLLLTALVYSQGIATIVFGDFLSTKMGWSLGSGRVLESRATIGGLNDLSGFIALTLPWIVAMTIYSKKTFTRVINIILLAAGVIIIAISQERAAFISVLLGLLVIYLLSRPKGKIKVVLIFTIIFVAIMSYVPSYLASSRFRDSWADSSNYVRLNALEDAKDLGFESPYIGNGFGLVYPRGWEDNQFIFKGRLMLVDPHNAFAFSFVETGIIGLTILIFVLTKILLSSYRSLAGRKKIYIPIIDHIGFSGSIFSFILFSMTSSALFVSPAFALCFWMIAGLVSCKNVKVLSEYPRLRV